MARVLKWVSGLIRFPHGAVTHISTKVVTAQDNMAPLFLPRLHSAAFISTSMRVLKKDMSQHGIEAPTGHKESKGQHHSDRNQDAKKAKEKFLQMKAVIDDNDLDIKIKKIRNWLDKGYHVKVKIMINQRNIEKNKTNSKVILKKLTDALEEDGKAPVPQFKETDIYIADFKDIPTKTDG